MSATLLTLSLQVWPTALHAALLGEQVARPPLPPALTLAPLCGSGIHYGLQVIIAGAHYDRALRSLHCLATLHHRLPQRPDKYFSQFEPWAQDQLLCNQLLYNNGKLCCDSGLQGKKVQGG